MDQSRDPVEVLEKARAEDEKTRFDRTRMTLEESARKLPENADADSIDRAARLSFAEAQENHDVIVEDDDEQILSPSTKLDAMFTFLKINFTSLWGSDPATESQFDAKVYKIKMQLEGIDEEKRTKIDV